MEINKKNIVVIGGGTGVFTVLTGLKKYPVELTAIVTMADDGGSTGVLREEFGILPPGDVRRVLVALAPSNNHILADLFNYRFAEGGLRGHAFGNIMLTALERVTGSFQEAVREASRILAIQGSVIPVTLENVRLSAELENGVVIRGETNIDIPQYDDTVKIRRVFLKPAARINIDARRAIQNADCVVIGPGDLYTSILSNIVVGGVKEALARSRAKKIYVVNLTTKRGETSGFEARDFIAAIEKYLGRGVLDYVVVNTKYPGVSRLADYEKEGAEFVTIGKLPKKPISILGDFMRTRGFLRHDPEKLAKVVVSLL